MYRIAVCDNNVADAQELHNQVQHLMSELGFEATVEVFRTARALCEAAAASAYHLILLETEIGNTNGVEVARRIRFLHRETEFIFVTRKEEYALSAYSVFPAGYLLTRVTRKRLYEPLLHALRRESDAPSVLFRTLSGGEVYVSEDDLLYVEVFGNDLVLHCKKETLSCVGSLSGVMENLNAQRFYRSHRNFIVNLQYVQKIEHFYFGMTNGDNVAVAKNRYTEARAVLEEYRAR